MPGTKWLPEHHQRRVRAAAHPGECGVAATVRGRANGEGEDRQKLTVIVVGWTASSGDDRSKRGGRGDLGGRRLKTTTVKTKRSFPAHLAR